MSTTFANSIDSNPIYADRAENDKDGNRIDQTYAKSASLATVATTGDYDDLSDKPDLSIYAETANLATVATTGSYDDLADKPTIPAAQVNSDWNASSGVAEILNKPTLSTVATTGDYDDLVNKPSIPAAQVNADWNSSSGVSEILNKPTLATVATTGAYSDLSGTPSIPTKTSDLTNDSNFITLSDVPAQVQADWTESDSTDPSYIANKPTLAAVATSGDYADLTGTPTINNVPAVTSSDDAKVLKASYTGGVGSYSWETETGTTYSAGTGIDISQNNEISVENPLPASTSAEAGKYLKVDANGDPEWATGGGGGGGVNADWDETDPLEPDYIQNKPVPKTLVAGTNITITENSSTLTVAATWQNAQADWTETDPNEPAYIQHKPTLATVATSGDYSDLSNTPTVDQTYDSSSTNAQSGVAVAEGLSTKADIFNVGDGLNLDTTGVTPVVKFDTPTQYSTYTDVVASKAHTSVSTVFTAIVLGPFVTLSGNYDPMAVITISSNTDTLLCTLKDGFKPVMDTYVTNYPGNGSIPYGGLHIAPDGKVYIHQNGTTNSQTRFFSVTYMRQM